MGLCLRGEAVVDDLGELEGCDVITCGGVDARKAEKLPPPLSAPNCSFLSRLLLSV
jgi:hypothetical protein